MGVVALAVAIVLVLLSACMPGCTAAFDGYDGLPRPSGMAAKPASTYGLTPQVKYENQAADCTWYGFHNANYDPVGTTQCSTQLWASLIEGADRDTDRDADPNELTAFVYYVPSEAQFYDPEYAEYLCAIGCFRIDLAVAAAAYEATAPPASFTGVAPVPPTRSGSLYPPPPVLVPPPPATLFRPPPPTTALPPPASLIPPPAPAPARSPSTSPVASPPRESAGCVLTPGVVISVVAMGAYFLSAL